MQKKLVLALLATVVVAAALVGVALAQFVGAQTQNSTAPQLVQLPNGQYVYGVPAQAGVNGTLVYPCYPYGTYLSSGQAPQVTQQAPASGYGYGYGYGRGMCGRFW